MKSISMTAAASIIIIFDVIANHASSASSCPGSPAFVHAKCSMEGTVT